jgi:hypothetical protein
LSRCYGRGGVNDAGAPQVVATMEVRSKMQEPLSHLLGVSFCTIMEGTHSDPCQSGSRISNIFDYAKDILIVFCREPNVPVASMRRLGWIGDTKACITEQTETRIRR